MSSSTSSPELETPSQTLGTALAQLRQAQGLSLNEVSIRTKYSTSQLDALEHDNWDVLPSGVPLRWMVKGYARALDADEEAMLSLLGPQQGKAPYATRSDLRQATDWSSAERSLYSEPTQRSWGWWLIILVLVSVAVFYALNQGWIPEDWLIFDWLKEFRS